jgi:MoaA/NifB/PqqE/SkfB family radical SAM enzyme
MSIRARLKHYKKQGKIIIHKAGQFLLRPVWNYLPDEASYGDFNVVIILTTICNANCIFCHYQFLPRSERINMPDTIFSSIIENIKRSGILSVHLTSNSGEPLMAPNLLEKIKALRDAGVRTIQLTTNGILLDKIGIDQFLESGPDIINISTTAFDADMYKRIYRSNQFERMRNNIMNLLTRNKLRPNPRLITIGIRPDIPKEDVLAMPETQRLIDLADEVNIAEAYGDWGGEIKNSMLFGSMKIEEPAPISNRPCQVLITTPAIYPNGDILACACRNIHRDPDLYLGHILEIDLGSALCKIKNIAANWRNGKIPQTCHRCTMYGDPSYYWSWYLRQLIQKMGNHLFHRKIRKQ